MNRYEKVRETILEHHTWHAWMIAQHIGLDEEMGEDEATEYVKKARGKMRADGDLVMPPEVPPYAEPEDRLADVIRLFEIRKYNTRKKYAETMLLALCYWTMQIKGNFEAVKETMEMNDRLKRPLQFAEIERICNTAQEYGFRAIDTEENERAIKKGLPGAGLNWTSATLFYKFGVTEEELQHLKTIGKPVDKTKPWGIPNSQNGNNKLTK